MWVDMISCLAAQMKQIRQICRNYATCKLSSYINHTNLRCIQRFAGCQSSRRSCSEVWYLFRWKDKLIVSLRLYHKTLPIKTKPVIICLLSQSYEQVNTSPVYITGLNSQRTQDRPCWKLRDCDGTWGKSLPSYKTCVDLQKNIRVRINHSTIFIKKKTRNKAVKLSSNCSLS